MYFKLLEMFILRTIFNKDEYIFTSKNFNPIKFFIVLILFSNIFFTIYLLNQLHELYNIIQKTCPQILEVKKEKINNINKINDKKP